MALRPAVGPAILAACVAVLVAACDLLPATRPTDLRVHYAESWLYPGPQVACFQMDRCADYQAEVERWASENAREHLPIESVSFHSAVDAEGNGILLNRSGGNSWIAIIAFADGSYTAVITGCGVGISPDVCFTEQ